MQESTNSSSNPYLKVENPYDDYEKSVQKNLQSKHSQEMLTIQRLCYQVFHMTEEGKQLYEALVDKFIMGTLYNPNVANVEQHALYWEGFRECIRSFKTMCTMHAQMINQAQPEIK